MSGSLPMIVAMVAVRLSAGGIDAPALRLIPMGARLSASRLMVRLIGVD